jgi:hypothetical protein
MDLGNHLVDQDNEALDNEDLDNEDLDNEDLDNEDLENKYNLDFFFSFFYNKNIFIFI